MGDEWNDICTQASLAQTNELIASPGSFSVPSLISNAVFSGPEAEERDVAANVASVTQSPGDTDGSFKGPECSTESEADPKKFKPIDESQTISDFLPKNSYFFNSKNCYIFPGAELWWKDSDDESISTDSTSSEEDDVTDLEIDNIRNELEQSYSALDDSQQQSQSDYTFSSSVDFNAVQSSGDPIPGKDLNVLTDKQYNTSTAMATVSNQCEVFSFNHTTVGAETSTAASSTTVHSSNFNLKRGAQIAFDYCDSDQVVCNSSGFDDDTEFAQKRHRYSLSESESESSAQVNDF